jgi:hypothetical protein
MISVSVSAAQMSFPCSDIITRRGRRCLIQIKKQKFNLLCKFFHCLLFSSFLWERLERGSKFSRKISKTFHQQFYFSHHREPRKNEFPSKPKFSSKRTILRKLIKFQNCAKVLNPKFRTPLHPFPINLTRVFSPSKLQHKQLESKEDAILHSHSEGEKENSLLRALVK